MPDFAEFTLNRSFIIINFMLVHSFRRYNKVSNTKGISCHHQCRNSSKDGVFYRFSEKEATASKFFVFVIARIDPSNFALAVSESNYYTIETLEARWP